MSWTNYFDKIFVVSLMKDQTLVRLFSTLKQLEHFDIETVVFEATYNETGAVGLRQTMIALFTKCLDKGYNNILVFEDDIEVVSDINYYMPLCLQQLPKDYDLFFLGAHVIKPFIGIYSENLLLLGGSLATHAVAYSRKTIENILPIFKSHSQNPRDNTAIDMLLLNRIIVTGKSFISYPLLVSQISGFSFIENKYVDYKKYIEMRYDEHLKKIFPDGKQ